MKKLCFLAIVLSLLGSGVWASTIGTWVGPTGSFADNSKWTGNNGPSTWTSTSTGDEVKICVENSLCTLSTAVTTTAAYRYSVAMGPNGATLQIVNGGSLGFGETRIGAQGATASYSIGRVNQTGGSVTYRDLLLGRGGTSGNPDIQGYYTISGGSIGYTSAYGRLYVGCGNSVTISGSLTKGIFTVVGNDATILFGALWVGGNTTTYGTGTLEYRVDPDGVSPIKLDGACNLDQYTADPTLSKAYLVVSATGATTPQADIVLVQQNAAAAVIGKFDTLNGGSAAEGTQIVLGDNVYKLTYTYAANDATQNDIALVHVANFLDLAHNPNPANGATVTTLPSLSWTNPDPNHPGGVLTCDVYFGKGTDPNRLTMDKKTLGAGVSSVAVNSTNFPHYVPLSDKTWYYWIVDVHDTTDPNVLYGIRWKVYTDINTAPVVNAGADQAVWLGKSGTPGQVVVALNATATDDGLPNPPAAMTYTWAQVPNGAPAVTITPNNVKNTTVTMTAKGTYQFTFTAGDSIKSTSDTVQIIVGTNSCDASHMSTGNPYDAGDQIQDCIVNLKDFAAFIAANWLDCTDTLTNCGI